MSSKNKKSIMYFYDKEGLSKEYFLDLYPWKHAVKTIRKLSKSLKLSYIAQGKQKFIFWDHNNQQIIKVYKRNSLFYRELDIWKKLQQKGITHWTTPTTFYKTYSTTVWADPLPKNYNLNDCSFKKYMPVDHYHCNLGVYNGRVVIIDLGNINL